MIKIINFIREHDNWEELLSSPPYSLSIKRKDTRILFKYSQIDSDFSLEIVREARGLILEDKTWNVVCYPFKKFYNRLTHNIHFLKTSTRSARQN